VKQAPVTNTFIIQEGMQIYFAPQPDNVWNAAILEDQTFIVAWSGYPSHGQNSQVYALRFNQLGVPINFNPNSLNKYTVCDTVNFKCANQNYKLVYIGDDIIQFSDSF
jgi:hypothetical protein